MDSTRLYYVRLTVVVVFHSGIQWLFCCYSAKSPGLGGISRIAEEREKVSTSNHLTINEIPNRYLHAKFRGKRRYKNVQGHIVGAGCTTPRAQVQLGRGVRVSYYMKGGSEGVV